jgi:predicted transcriptional regulator
MARKPATDYSGDLQAEVMAAVWKLGEAKVEDVRGQRPARSRLAYTTVQTVMNRLAERGLLTRERNGNAFVYRPRYQEGAYVAARIGERLAAASPNARKQALVSLIEDLEPGELDEVARMASRIKRRRGKG